MSECGRKRHNGKHAVSCLTCIGNAELRKGNIPTPMQLINLLAEASIDEDSGQ